MRKCATRNKFICHFYCKNIFDYLNNRKLRYLTNVVDVKNKKCIENKIIVKNLSNERKRKY